jgi:hypothetical protein
MKRPRLRKWAKWACTLVSVALTGVAVASGFYSCSWIGLGAAYRSAGIRTGTVFYHEFHVMGGAPVPGWHIDRDLGWTLGLSGTDVRSCPGIRWAWEASWKAIHVSAVYPALLASLPAALLWYVDRRRFGPGRCTKCGYDRRGLVGGADAKCPECGTVPTRG